MNELDLLPGGPMAALQRSRTVYHFGRMRLNSKGSRDPLVARVDAEAWVLAHRLDDFRINRTCRIGTYLREVRQINSVATERPGVPCQRDDVTSTSKYRCAPVVGGIAEDGSSVAVAAT